MTADSDAYAPSKRTVSMLLSLLLGVFLCGVLLQIGVGLWIDANWFAHLGYSQVWLLNRLAPWGLWLIVFLGIGLWLRLNLWIAWPKAKSLWHGLGIAIASGSVATLAMLHWFTVLTALLQRPVGEVDPILQHDISFYLFTLPLLLPLQRWGLWIGLCTVGLVALWYGIQFSQVAASQKSRLLRTAQRHLLGLGSLLLLFQGLGHWLARYTLMYSNRGSFAGANFTDVHTQMPVNGLLTGMAIMAAIALCVLALFTPGVGHLVTAPSGESK